MNYYVWQRTIVDAAGNVLPSASVTVTDAVSGSLATLYSDAGVTVAGNPITANSSGFAKFYVKSGRYNITAASGAYSITWSDENIGSPYPRTSAEIAAGITPTNPDVPSHEQLGYVDPHRYGTNTTPGTTNFYQPIADAINVAERTADADGVNMPVRLRAERYAYNTQIVVPYGVSLIGAGERSTTLEPLSAFANMSSSGALRVGTGTGPCFGSIVSDLLLQMNSFTGIGCYSSDIQSGGFIRVTVNNFTNYGFLIDGSAGPFGSINGFSLEHCQAFKANTGGTSGVGIKIKDGTFPAHIHTCQVYGNPSNPLTTGYEIENFPFIASDINVDGAGTTGILLNTSVPIAVVSGYTSNGFTTAVKITTTGKVSLFGVYRASGTNTIVDDGNSGVAKTITDTVIARYERSGTTPGIAEKADFYGQVRIAAGVRTSLILDKSGAIGVGRFKAFIGDGTSSTTADEVYIESLNTDLHFMAGVSGTTEILRLLSGGGLCIADGITAPSTQSGFAAIYVDTADGDLKIKFGDGTVKTIVTDN